MSLAGGANGHGSWDILIVGAGPAGLTAAMYGARAGLNTAVLDLGPIGGQMAAVDAIENYPGFAEPLTGLELSLRMQEQARRFGARFLTGDAASGELNLAAEVKVVGGHRARAVIIATGARPRRLSLPGEERLTGRGVSYCATCDGPFFRGQRVAVIGGGDSAVSEALFLSRIAGSVVLIHRRERFRAASNLVSRLGERPNISVLLERLPVEIQGETRVEGLTVERVGGGPVESLPVDGVFIYVGLDPATSFLRGHLEMDPEGYIPADDAMRTSLTGVYAAGDVRAKEVRQVITAAADGALAAMSAERDLIQQERTQSQRVDGG